MGSLIESILAAIYTRFEEEEKMPGENTQNKENSIMIP